MVTFSLFLEDGFDVIEATFCLSKRIHTMDVVTMEGFIKDNERDIGNGTEVNKVFMGQWHPNFEEVL